MLGWSEILIIIALGVIVFNARRLPELAKALGSAKKAFKKGLAGEEEDRPSREVKAIDPESKEKQG